MSLPGDVVRLTQDWNFYHATWPESGIYRLGGLSIKFNRKDLALVIQNGTGDDHGYTLLLLPCGKFGWVLSGRLETL